jgi:predicted nucleotidyltransferase component of viral defense system
VRLSHDILMADAGASGFRPEILEKCELLLSLLQGLVDDPFLGPRLVLKGGTALNLFVFDVPRLSLDANVNYIGAADVGTMETERPLVEAAIRSVCQREGFRIGRTADKHAGGKWHLVYASALGGNAELQLDVNFMLRVPLWPVVARDSRTLGHAVAYHVPVLDVNELAAGKLAALLSRHASRDLFDAHQLLASGLLDPERLRIAFVVYGGANRLDWRTVAIRHVLFEARELRDQVIPVLHRSGRTEGVSDSFAKHLLDETRAMLAAVLPLRERESAFLEALLADAIVDASLLTDDPVLRQHIQAQPGLHWKALNVRKNLGL